MKKIFGVSAPRQLTTFGFMTRLSTRRNSEVDLNCTIGHVLTIAKGSLDFDDMNPLYKQISKLGSLYTFLVQKSKFVVTNDNLTNKLCKIVRREIFDYLMSLSNMEGLNLRQVLHRLQNYYSKLRSLAIALEEVQCLTDDCVLTVLKRLSINGGDDKIFDDLYDQIMSVWVDMACQFVSNGIILKKFYITKTADFGWDVFAVDISKSPVSKEMSEKILYAGKAIYHLKLFNLESPKIIINESFEATLDHYYIENNLELVKCLVSNLREFVNVSNDYLFFRNCSFREMLLNVTFENQILTFPQIYGLIPEGSSKYLLIEPGLTNDIRGYINNFDSQFLDIKLNKLLSLVINDEFLMLWKELSHRIWILARIDRKLKMCWNTTDQHVTRYEMSHAIRWLRLYYHQVTIEANEIIIAHAASVDGLIGNVGKGVEFMKQSIICECELVELINLWLNNYNLDKCHLRMSKYISAMMDTGILKNLNFNSYYYYPLLAIINYLRLDVIFHNICVSVAS